MNPPTRQIPSDPARDFANAIFAETNNGQDLIDLLHDIAQGAYGATYNDRISANTILTDRGLGKCPKQSPAANPHRGEHAPSSDEEGQSEPKATDEPESPRLVTQIDDSLHQSLGPAPSAHSPDRHSDDHENPESPDPFDPLSIQTSIQNYILEITNNGETLRTALKDIAFADPEDSNIKASHRRRAVTLLLDRLLGTDPALLRNGVCPECHKKWAAHADSPAHPERSAAEPKDADEEPFDKEVWDGIIAELKQLEEDGVITPDPNPPKLNYTYYGPPDGYVIPPEVAAEEAAKFRADIALRVERQKQWPEIEERRRKKLAQIYPSHSEKDPPET